MSAFELSVRFFLQLAVILIACRIVGWIAARFRQPQVVGEMVAGIALGPSLFGALAPQIQGWLFPEESRPILYAASQLALSLYMFLIGTEFDVELLRQRFRQAVSVSIAGIAAPFCLGVLLANLLAESYDLFDPGASHLQASLFLGAALSITAFPMLARIIHEQGLSSTSLGTLAIGAAAIDDAAAWCILAIALASFKSQPWIAWLAIVGGVAYTSFCLVIVRRCLAGIAKRVQREGTLSREVFATVLILLTLGCWFTDRIGIYAVFGAFVFGLSVPRGELTEQLRKACEPLVVVLFLPLFFVYSGLHTELMLLSDAHYLGAAFIITLAAIAGKGVACAAAARFQGESMRTSIGIGALMNSRGLMELIAVNIGLEYGIITPTLFTILVLMAIVTTLMATPLFEAVYLCPDSGRRTADP